MILSRRILLAGLGTLCVLLGLSQLSMPLTGYRAKGVTHGGAKSDEKSHRILGEVPVTTAVPRVPSKVCHAPLSGGIRDTLWVAMAAWDDRLLLLRSLDSVMSQTGVMGGPPEARMPRGLKHEHRPPSHGEPSLAFTEPTVAIKVVVFEDRSHNLLSAEEQAYYAARMDVVFLRPPPPLNLTGAATVADGDSHQMPTLGSAGGKWTMFEHIRLHALPADYVLVFDGDDVLADGTSLSYIHDKMSRDKSWFGWGRHNGKYSNECGDIPHKEMVFADVRQSKWWSYCHPRVFVASLLEQLDVRHFQRDDGTWLQKSTDRPFIYGFMELAGPDRVTYLGGKAAVNYTFTKNNGLTRFSSKTITGDKQLVRSRPALKRKPMTMHVFMAVFDRNNTAVVLKRLVDSIGIERLVIHVCNNDPLRQTALEQTALRVVSDWEIGSMKSFRVGMASVRQVFRDGEDKDTLAQVNPQAHGQTQRRRTLKNMADPAVGGARTTARTTAGTAAESTEVGQGTHDAKESIQMTEMELDVVDRILGKLDAADEAVNDMTEEGSLRVGASDSDDTQYADSILDRVFQRVDPEQVVDPDGTTTATASWTTKSNGEVQREIVVHNLGQNIGGFSRFLVARKVTGVCLPFFVRFPWDKTKTRQSIRGSSGGR